MQALCRLVLRLAGVLVFAAGILHLWMTEHVMHLLAAMERGETSELARAAMQLNHLVVGILLLPLGATLAVIGQPLARREPWARMIGLACVLALLALPIVVLATSRAQMLEAPAFVAAVAMLFLAALMAGIAVCVLGFGRAA